MGVPSPGHKFNDWTLIRYNSYQALCRCKCGIVKRVQTGSLKNGSSKRCKPCSRKLIGRAQVGGMTRRYGRGLSPPVFRRLRIVVDNAIARCSDESLDQWKDYGGRGIKVCSEWLENKGLFLEYLATLPGHDDTSLVIDRIENEEGYRPGNLRFVTSTVSSQNRRRDYGNKLAKDSSGRFVNKS